MHPGLPAGVPPAYDGGMAQVHVSLSDRSYEIHIAQHLATEIRTLVDALAVRKRGVVVAVDEAFLKAQEQFVKFAFGGIPRYVVPSGETSKCFAQLESLTEFLAQKGLARDGVLFACGGGVTGDLAGFAAASYQRGISFVQVPTTLLSMVDSSVGGKTGINIKAGKNLVGAFWQPMAVFADLNSLSTLPPREFSAGMGEIIKYGMLADAGFFAKLEGLPRLEASSPELADIVARCCELKAQVVAGDERETAKNNGRALLNLGHTFAHAVENAAGYGTYLHGEAVGLGLYLAARLSEEMGMITADEVRRTKELLVKYDLPVTLRQPLPLATLEAAAKHDKKVREGKVRYVVMAKLGEAVTHEGVDTAFVAKLWKEAGAQ
jgi:3-dehydroquinate synthase